MVSVAAAHPGPFTIDDLVALPDDELRYELIDGSFLVSPPPLPSHQWAENRLVILLHQQLPEDVVAVETVGVQCGKNLLIPDVLIVPRTAFRGAHRVLDSAGVLAVVEIMSPGSRRDDCIRKPLIYAEGGIPVYVRVEPPGVDDAAVVIAHELASGVYRETGRAGYGQTVTLNLPGGICVSVDPAELVP